MKYAKTDVVRHPDQQNPSRPVAATQKKCSRHDCDQSQQTNPNQTVTKSTWRPELVRVVEEADRADKYEQPADNGDGQGTLLHKEKPATSIIITRGRRLYTL